MTSLHTPLVSIITPVFNSEDFLSNTIRSVLAQSFSDWEHILIDDGSSDSSLDILKYWSSIDGRIRVYSNESNVGSGISRNRAIDLALGRYIAFLDSDDIWTPNKLEIQIDLMRRNQLAFCHTSYGYIDEKGIEILRPLRVSSKPVTYSMLLRRTEISCLTAVYDAAILGKCYMSEHRLKQDYALWLSILRRGYTSYPIDKKLAFYRQRKKSSTSKKWKLIWSHVTFLVETQKIGYSRAIYYTIFWGINGLFRYYFAPR